MKHSIALLFLALSAAVLGAQTADDWFWNKPIESVQWEGIKQAPRKELDAVTRPYIGKIFTEETWLEIQAAVYGLDWFETIDPVALPSNDAKSKVIIKFSVTEKPSVEAVRFLGNEGLRTNELLGVVVSKEGSIFNSDKVAADIAALRKLYAEKGYPDANLSWTSNPGNGAGKIVLAFKITEGSKVAVRAIRFTGNSAVSTNILKGQMELKEAALFQSGIFQEAQLESSRQAIVSYYRNKGYIDARIIDVLRTYEKDVKSGKTWLILTIALSEGKQWTFGGMTFSGNKVFPTAKLAAQVSQKTGTLVSERKLNQDKQRIDDLYYESGYIFNTIDMVEKRDAASVSISYEIRIVERDRAHIETISFKGNTKTKDFVLSREMPLEVGDIFSKAKIIEGLRNLYNLQYFSAVQPDMQQGSAENLMNLAIAVEEQSTANIQFGVTLSGFGTSDTFPISGQVKWNDRNFLGMGKNLKIEGTGSPDTQSIVFGYGENWLFGKRISYSIDLNFTHASKTTGQDSLDPIYTDEDIPDPFNGINTGTNPWDGSLSSIPDAYLMPYEDWSASIGGSTGYSFRTEAGDVGINAGLSFGVTRWDYDSEKYRPYLRSMRKYAGQWLIDNKLTTRVYLNNLDLWYNPSSGYFAGQRLTWNGFFNFEYQHYIKSETKLEAYVTLFNIPVTDAWRFKWVLGAHSGFQALLAQPGRELGVVDDYISLDGTFNARGWKSLYGQDGVAFWENSLELRMPLIDQVLWLDGFLDVAAMQAKNGLMNMTGATPFVETAKPDFRSLGWENVAFSTGFGFRFAISQFPFRFYFLKRFTFDGSAVTWKTSGTGLDFVLSITQPL